jgi:hypothetical protein
MLFWVSQKLPRCAESGLTGTLALEKRWLNGRRGEAIVLSEEGLQIAKIDPLLSTFRKKYQLAGQRTLLLQAIDFASQSLLIPGRSQLLGSDTDGHQVTWVTAWRISNNFVAACIKRQNLVEHLAVVVYRFTRLNGFEGQFHPGNRFAIRSMVSSLWTQSKPIVGKEGVLYLHSQCQASV